MIVRDNLGVIVQHRRKEPEYKDGGDSARSTGLMALTGSKEDIKILHHFEIGHGLLNRHPK